MNRRPQLIESVKLGEGLRLMPYRDSKGFLSIGYGHNLDAKPLSWLRLGTSIPKRIAEAILDVDVDDAIRDLDVFIPWWRQLDDVREQALAELSFNMGIGNQKHGLRSFVNTLPALQEGRWSDAYNGLMHSAWASDVGVERSQRIGNMLLTGIA